MSHSFRIKLRLISLGLFLFCRVGFADRDVGITAFFLKAAAEVIVAAIYRTGPAFACYEVMPVRGFDFFTADVAADCVFDNHLIILPEWFINKVRIAF